MNDDQVLQNIFTFNYFNCKLQVSFAIYTSRIFTNEKAVNNTVLCSKEMAKSLISKKKRYGFIRDLPTETAAFPFGR